MNHRSPWFPFILGCSLLLVSVLAYYFRGESLFVWILLTAAIPLILEGEAWRQAAAATALFYDIDEDTVLREAYNPRAAILRYVLLYGWMFSILVTREAGLLPVNSLWVLVIIFLPTIVFLTHAIVVYRSDIRKLLKARNAKRISRKAK